MQQLAGILKEFMGNIEPQEPAPLTFGEGTGGKAKEARPRITPSAASLDRLAERLERQVGLNNRILVVIVVVYALLFAVAAVLVIAHHNDVGWIQAFVGGNVLALTAVGSRLLDVWREKNYMDMLLAILPTLAPAEALRVIEAFYLEKLKKPARKGRKVALGGRP
jgi:hypothetical protein